MAGRNPNEAFRQFIDPLRDALSCVTQARLTMLSRETVVADRIYTVALNDLDPIRLKAPHPLHLSIGQVVRIVRTDDPDDPRGPYKVQTVEYFYDLRSDDDTELLTFHWTPEAEGEGIVTFPHLHVGSVLLVRAAPTRSQDFHKVHIPTGRVSVEAIIRLAIIEFGAVPLKANWAAELDRTEAAFLSWRTRAS